MAFNLANKIFGNGDRDKKFNLSKKINISYESPLSESPQYSSEVNVDTEDPSAPILNAALAAGNAAYAIPSGLLGSVVKQGQKGLSGEGFNYKELGEDALSTIKSLGTKSNAPLGEVVSEGIRKGLPDKMLETTGGQFLAELGGVAAEAPLIVGLGKKAIKPTSIGESMATQPVSRAIEKGIPESITNAITSETKGATSLSSKLKMALRDEKGAIGKITGEGETLGGNISEVGQPLVSESKAIQKTEPEIQKYVKELVNKRDAAYKSDQAKLPEKVSTFYKKLKARLVDSTSAIEDELRSAQKKHNFEVLPEKDISNQISRVISSPTISAQFIKDNGLEDVIKSVDDLDSFEQYLIAKHSQKVESVKNAGGKYDAAGLFESRKGITGRDLEKDSKLIGALAPKYEEAANKVTQYSRNLLDYITNAGLISKDSASKLKALYPDYVPLQRVFSDLEKEGMISPLSGRGKGFSSLSKQTIVKKLEGSQREIESPLFSLITRTNDAVYQSEKNIAARTLAEYRKLPGFDQLIREGEGPVNATFSYLDNGVKRTFVTTPEIAEAAKNLNYQNLGLTGKIFASGSRALKIGTTGLNVPFVAANLVKDQMFRVINSSSKLKDGLLNPVNFVKALFSATKKTGAYEEMARQGAAQISFDVMRNQPLATLEKIRARGKISSKLKYTIRHPSELVRAVEDTIGITERTTRAQEFLTVRNGLLKQGRSQTDANILAAKAAREVTADFSRKGSWGNVINSLFPYLNANIQGSRSFLKAAAQRPMRTAAKAATVLYVPETATTTWNLSDPKRKQAYMDIDEREKENNFIIIPPDPQKDENGNWIVYKIPKPPGVGKLAVPIRKAIEQFNGMNEVGFKDFANAVIGPISPIDDFSAQGLVSTFTPQLIKPSVEAVTNSNLYTGAPNVPEPLKRLSKELQVKKDTSGTARLIGKAAKASPIKTQEFIRGTFGELGLQGLNASDRALSKLGIIPKDQIGGRSISEGVTRRFFKARGGASERENYKEVANIVQKQNDQRFKLLQEAEKTLDDLKEMSREEKAIKLKSLNPQVVEKMFDVAQDRELGLTPVDRAIKQLGVKNGERAKYLSDKLKSFKSREDKIGFLNDMKNKKLLTEDVLDQMVA
jgi:hypothetical protein